MIHPADSPKINPNDHWNSELNVPIQLENGFYRFSNLLIMSKNAPNTSCGVGSPFGDRGGSRLWVAAGVAGESGRAGFVAGGVCTTRGSTNES